MTTQIMLPLPSRQSVDRLAGFVLGLTAALTLIAVLHHPTIKGVHGAEETAQAIQALAGMDKLVHGALMLIFSAQAFGFYFFSVRLGFGRPGVLAGFMAYMIGTLIMFIPTTFDGFITPDLTDACAQSPNCGVLPVAMIDFIAVAIQDFTKIALVAMSLGTLFWSMTVVRLPDALNRTIGGVGLACGIVPIAVFGLSRIYLQPGNLAMIVLAPVVWALAAAVLMVGKRQPD